MKLCKVVMLFVIVGFTANATEPKKGKREVVLLNDNKFIGVIERENEWVSTINKIHPIPDSLYYLSDSTFMKAYRSGETLWYERTRYSYTGNVFYDM